MSELQNWIHTAAAKTLGLALAHFVWEGVAIAALLGIALWMTRGASARVRYAVACAALAAMPVAFGLTLAVLTPHSSNRVTLAIPAPESSRVDFPIPASAPEPWRFADHIAWATPLWIAGVLCLFVYRLASWIAAERLRRLGTWAAPHEWSGRVKVLAERVGVSRAVKLLESALAEVPMVIGYVRPVILIPMGMLAGLPPDQVEAILLHELAHIRRADYLVNLLQSVIESLLFYHPAVWWVSSVVRAERENCCDDFVIARETDPGTYAAALLALEQGRSGDLVVAANGGNLLNRVRRMLRKPAAHDRSLAILPVVLAIAGIGAAGVAFAAWQPEVTKEFAKDVAANVVKPVEHGVSATSPIAPIRRSPSVLLAQAQQAGQTGQGARSGRGGLPAVPAAEAVSNTPYSKWVNEDAAYIISKAEREAWDKLVTDQEREQFITDFWARRNPIRGSATNEYKEEHYRRIAYANEHFKSEIPGWKSDRGRMYISYGPPDEIEAHPSGGAYTRPAEQGGGTTYTYPFQKWRYRYIEGIGQNVIVEFVDKDKNGEYPLTTDPSKKDVRMAPANQQPIQIVQGVPFKQSDRIREQLATLLKRYTQENPEVQAVKAQLDQALHDEAVNGNAGFGGTHSGVAIRPNGEVDFVIPLVGPGPFHIYGRITTTGGRPVSSFEEDQPAGPLNFVRTLTLKPGSYIFSVAMKSGSDSRSASEMAAFEVK